MRRLREMIEAAHNAADSVDDTSDVLRALLVELRDHGIFLSFQKQEMTGRYKLKMELADDAPDSPG